jgi:PAS domain S-box-containing protein
MSTGETPLSGGKASAPLRFPDPHDSHTVQFYAEDAVLLDAVSRFLGDTLEAGGAVLVVATAAHRDGITHRLQARGLDPSGAIQSNRLILLDAAETLSKFILEGWPDPLRFANIIGAELARARHAAKSPELPVVVFGEMVALLAVQGKFDTAIRLEQLWNGLARDHNISLRCAYPMSGFNRQDHSEPFLKICSEHSRIIPGESYTALTSEDERLRTISHLQQRAHALDLETAERKQAQKALQTRESELADLLENALEGIQRTGPDQKIVWANKAMLKLLGYTAQEYIGHHLAEFFVDRNAFEEYWAKLLRREEVYDYPAELRCWDGGVRHVVIHSNALWENGKFIHTRTFIHDVTERREMERALQQAHDDLETRVRERTNELIKKNLQILEQSENLDETNRGLRELSARLLQVQDDERRRIARDLHDSTGQSLALLSMNLSAIEKEAVRSNPDLAKVLAENAELVRRISSELRTLSYLLYPPLLEEMGLESALRWYIDGFRQRSSTQVTLELSRDLERLSRDLEIVIFRVIQECLTNIHRHSESPVARIRLSRASGTVTLEVEDEGKGIAPEKLARISTFGAPGVGLRGMRERIKDLGGNFKLESGEKGTTVVVSIPLGRPAPDSQSPDGFHAAGD